MKRRTTLNPIGNGVNNHIIRVKGFLIWPWARKTDLLSALITWPESYNAL
jgi:hypothetical protein